eukprot:CAMPEP_0183707758 /NCGR_PEP_ID=MMETSP0737-20130205/4236_1 /TAXON_ID=385413 /ORGANISM="Thalassiosira miniscula, Strain CCMP1093" /LENGTH=779 /DNA_ID=CAMNT_0025935487 /DNA_START=81 /DNA_END=2420 /DNA_ORIENTATION=+
MNNSDDIQERHGRARSASSSSSSSPAADSSSPTRRSSSTQIVQQINLGSVAQEDGTPPTTVTQSPPIPSSRMTALYEKQVSMEETLHKTATLLEQDNHGPAPPPHFVEWENTKEKGGKQDLEGPTHEHGEINDVPLTAGQVDALFGAQVPITKKLGSSDPSQYGDGNLPPISQDLQRAEGDDEIQLESPPERQQQATNETRNPPQSLLPRSAPDPDIGGANNELRAPIEATAVQGVEAELIVEKPPEPVYPAFVMEDDKPLPWWKRNKRCVVGTVSGLLLGLAVAIPVGLSFSRPDQGSEKSIAASTGLPTFQPSQSSFPSGIPSLRPSMRPSMYPSLPPSESMKPSQNPSMSLAPTQSSPPSTYSYWSDLVWQQRGRSITGDGEGDNLGSSVSISDDGLLFAVGGTGNFDGVLGQARVYKWNETALDYEQIGTPKVGFVGDLFGFTVALSGDGKILAVGAILNDDNGFESGKVELYEWNEAISDYIHTGQTWRGQSTNDYLGYAMDLSNDGKIFVMSAAGGDNGNVFNAGRVRIYGWDETIGEYNLLDELVGDYGGDSFGSWVSCSGDCKTLAVGAVQWPDGTGTGYAKVLQWDESTLTYQQIGRPITGDARSDQAGFRASLSADGNTLAISAPGPYDLPGKATYDDFTPGYVKAYRWDEDTSNFIQVGQTLNGDAVGDWFGQSLSISSDGNTLAVGSPGDYAFPDRPGHLKVFRLDDNLDRPRWRQIGDPITGEQVGNEFGLAVDLSADGTTLVTGAPFQFGTGLHSGLVKVMNIEI